VDYAKESLRLHEEWKGKIEVVATVPVETKDDLSLAYTPGVAQPCLEIQKDINKSYELTRRHNLCAVITDGTAVLGLGDIGPEAGMPVMEGKCVLFKSFGNVDAFPLCVKTKDVDEFVNTVYLISGSFGGINLEDIAAPRCFEIERKLKEKCDIPIFHDDQHGTAVITLAGLTNALKVVGKKMEDVRIVVSGAGAAAISISEAAALAGRATSRCATATAPSTTAGKRHELDQGGDGPGHQPGERPAAWPTCSSGRTCSSASPRPAR
jgi:malate dehydrogenase (oxaloacetate-decarboxylating)